MSEKTKSCNLTEDEIECLIGYHGRILNTVSAIKSDKSETVERINYLNKRLKTFSEPEKVEEKAVETKAAGAWPNG